MVVMVVVMMVVVVIPGSGQPLPTVPVIAMIIVPPGGMVVVMMVVMVMMVMMVFVAIVGPVLRRLQPGGGRTVRVVGFEHLSGAGHRLQQVRISRSRREWFSHRRGGQGRACQDRGKRRACKQSRS